MPTRRASSRTAARLLIYARRSSGLNQRELARRSGVPQPTISRIERGRIQPRLDTLERLLGACGHRLDVEATPGAGVDRTAIRELLRLDPGERLRLATQAANALASLRSSSGRAGR